MNAFFFLLQGLPFFLGDNLLCNGAVFDLQFFIYHGKGQAIVSVQQKFLLGVLEIEAPAHSSQKYNGKLQPFALMNAHNPHHIFIVA